MTRKFHLLFRFASLDDKADTKTDGFGFFTLFDPVWGNGAGSDQGNAPRWGREEEDVLPPRTHFTGVNLETA